MVVNLSSGLFGLTCCVRVINLDESEGLLAVSPLTACYCSNLMYFGINIMAHLLWKNVPGSISAMGVRPKMRDTWKRHHSEC
jgi:hypothetical protein